MNSRFGITRVPEPLKRFAELACSWGERLEGGFSEELIERTQSDTDAMAELKAFVNAFTRAEWDALDEWRDRTRLMGLRERNYFELLIQLVDELNLWPPYMQPSIEDLISNLQRHGGLGMASKREIAAMYLAKRHAEAESAVPYLQPLLTDLDFRARVWAHCALGRITGERDRHRIAILAIQRACEDETNAVTLGDGRSTPRVRKLIHLTAAQAIQMLDEQTGSSP